MDFGLKCWGHTPIKFSIGKMEPPVDPVPHMRNALFEDIGFREKLRDYVRKEFKMEPPVDPLFEDKGFKKKLRDYVREEFKMEPPVNPRFEDKGFREKLRDYMREEFKMEPPVNPLFEDKGFREKLRDYVLLFICQKVRICGMSINVCHCCCVIQYHHSL